MNIKLTHSLTPVYRLERLSERWGGDIWIKRDDLTGSGLSGNKVRKLDVILTQALEKKADTVITCGGIQSNHCRATAIAAARVGMKCRLLLRGEPGDGVPDGNLFLDQLVDARIDYISSEDYYQHLDERLADIANDVRRGGGNPVVVPEGGSNSLGAMGLVEGLRELRCQCDEIGFKPKRIVAAAGSGGTHAGLYFGTRLQNWDVDVYSVAVCYDRDETVRRIFRIVEEMNRRHNTNFDISEKNIIVNGGYIGDGYAKAGAKEFAVIVEVARTEGVIVDPVYTGKAMRCIKEETARGEMPGSTLFWHTGGIFGIFPFKEQIARSFK